uniref:Sulfotransferase n=1 Tax=Labrus bergylta TaxID=56723 RepID=A0A3Q3EQE1_9LABR
MVSYYHFDLVFGSWYDHVNGWWKKKQTYSNLHYMFYEDLLEVMQSFSFSLWFIKEIVAGKVQFDNIKKNSMVNYSTLSVMDYNISPFMRKGKVSDWRNHFTVAQNEEFDKDYKKKMKDHTLQFRTEM